MSAGGAQARRQSWSDYWRTGALHSLPGSFQGNYSGAIGAFWERAFSSLTGDDRVIDIGTGNGALPALMLRNLAPSDLPGIDAVDLAGIAPAWMDACPAELKSSIRFHPDTAAEALPFPDHGFDLAVSQYGLEYTRLARSLPELARVLKRGGRLALVLHHASSRLAQVAREEAALIDWLLSTDGLFDTAAEIAPYLARVGQGHAAALAGDADADRARARFNAAMRAVAAKAARSPVPDVLLEARDYVAGHADRVLRSGSADVDGPGLASYADALRAAAFRHRELYECALDDDALARLVGALTGLGFGSIQTDTLRHESFLLGWSLIARSI